MKKVAYSTISVTVTTHDADGNVIDTVVQINDTVDCNRPGVAVNGDLQGLFKSVKMGFDRLASKLMGQLEITDAPAPADPNQKKIGE